jgi:hypothetical protein
MYKNIPRVILPAAILSFALAALSVSASAAQEPCLKQVLNRFCLGGDYNTQVRVQPGPVYQQGEGSRRAAVYLESRGKVYVMAHEGRIYKVVKESRPATQLHFDEIGLLLSEKYGPAKDRSYYPHHAKSAAARIVAIRRGEAEALQEWRPEPGWRVELSWTREMGVALSYIANDLEAGFRQALEQGL